jgi:hypothetical protein
MSSAVSTTPLPSIVQPTSSSSSNPTEPATTPTVYERFFGPTMFSELFPHIRPHLGRGDLSRLAQGGGVIGGQATIAMYQEKNLRVVYESLNHYRELAEVIIHGIDEVPIGRISKKEAMTNIREIDLWEPKSTIATNLLKIQFPHLRKLTIRSTYLRGVLILSHARKTIPGIPYTDFYNPDTPFDFAESRLISHLASYASTVEIYAPGTGLNDVFDDPYRAQYWSDMAKRLCPSGGPYADNALYWCNSNDSLFRPSSSTLAFRTVPDFGNILSWNRPIDKLVVWVKSPSAILQRIPAKNTTINLQEGALFDSDCRHDPDKIHGLAVVKSVLETRAVTSSSIVIGILPPARSVIVDYIRAVHPDLLKDWPFPRDNANWFDYYSPNSEYNAMTSLFMWRRTATENRDLPVLAQKRYLEYIKASLRKHHTKTDVEKEDFDQIQFTFRPLEGEEWKELSYEPMCAC